MTKTQYPTKYQITKLEQRVDEELDPIINLAELELKSVLAEETEIAMSYLAKKIKADKVINNLQKAVESLEIAQRQAITFFGKVKDNKLREKLSHKPEGKKLKELKLYKKASKHKIWECGVPEQLQSQLSEILAGLNIIWDKSKQLRLENKTHN